MVEIVVAKEAFVEERISRADVVAFAKASVDAKSVLLQLPEMTVLTEVAAAAVVAADVNKKTGQNAGVPFSHPSFSYLIAVVVPILPNQDYAKLGAAVEVARCSLVAPS